MTLDQADFVGATRSERSTRHDTVLPQGPQFRFVTMAWRGEEPGEEAVAM